MKKESDTKLKLLQTAIDLMWQQSYGSVSVDDICARAGVKKGSFYYFFESKSDLTVAAYEEHWQQNRPNWDRMFSAQTPPLERLASYCDYVYQRQKQKFEQIGKVCGCPYCAIGSELSTQDEKVRLKTEEIFERNCRYFESALRDAANEGLIDGRDVATKARGLYSYIIGVILQAKIQNRLELLEDLKGPLFRLIGVREVSTAG